MKMAVAGEFDTELPMIEAVKAGDRSAFAELVRRHGAWVRAVIYGVLGRADGVDDVVQQVWASAWERIGELRDPLRWRPWLYRLARNAALDAGRERTRRRRLHAAATDGAVRRSRIDAVEDDADDAEQRRAILAAIEGLPAIYREPFVLRNLNDWSYQQIAEAMNMPVDTVETRLVRARRLLREALKNTVSA